MEQVNVGRYADMIRTHYYLKMAMFVYGGPGIGKSEIPLSVFESICIERATDMVDVKNMATWNTLTTLEKHNAIRDYETNGMFKAGSVVRSFAEWKKLTLPEKINAINNPTKYFVYVDFRLTQSDPSDLKGIPKLFNDGPIDMLEFSPLSWVRYFENSEADGAIFFDELNLATSMLAAASYQIINEKTVGDIKLSDNVFIFGAGNRECDKAYVNPLPRPLRDRFNEFELIADADSWLAWATDNGISHHIITFINWKKAWINDIDSNNNSADRTDKPTTPRGICRASTLLKYQMDECNNGVLSEEVDSMLCIAVGSGFVAEFRGYLQHIKLLNVNQYLKNPKELRNIAHDGDKMYALCGVIIDYMPKVLSNGMDWDIVFDLIDEMSDEYKIMVLHNMQSRYTGNEHYTMSILRQNDRLYELIKKLLKYIAN